MSVMADRNDSKAQLAFEDELTIKTKTRHYSQKRMLQAATILLLLAGFVLIITLIIVSNDRSKKTSDLNVCIQEKEETCYTPHCVKTAANVIESMDLEVDPCDDFYGYACGGWVKSHTIPEDKSSYSSFVLLEEQLLIKLKELLEKRKSSSEPAAIAKLRDFYTSCTDTDAIEAKDAQPLIDRLTSLGGWPVLGNRPGGNWQEGAFDFEDLWSQLALDNGFCVIDAYVFTDPKNSERRILTIDQATLGTSRDYYLDENLYRVQRRAYQEYMVNVALLLGGDETQVRRDMTDVLDFETQLANFSVPKAERRDQEAMYNLFKLNEMDNTIPQINFRKYFDLVLEQADAVADDEAVVNYSPEYVKQAARLIASTPSRTVVNYMLWLYVKGAVPKLSERFRDVRQEYNKVLEGTSTPSPRWRDCAEAINSAMKFATGRMYVSEMFSGGSKTDTENLIGRLKESFKGFLETNQWMDEETKKVAAEKIDSISKQIGYPDWIMDDDKLNEEYEDVSYSMDDYFGNVIQNGRMMAKQYLTKLREPVDKNEWTSGPAVVNAYYNAQRNVIIFPAGILQPPFYHKDSPAYLNYGGIGMVIGHEITHGFDDRGRQFDKEGNLIQWWSNSSITEFKKRAQCIVDQYSQYSMPENGMKLNGKQTQGENIADNGGLKQSFNAYRRFAQSSQEEIQRLPGMNLNPEQLLYVNFAQVWCSLFRPEGVVSKILTGAHSPDRYRVIGTLHNSEEFARVFECSADSFMNSKKKCVIW